MAENPRDYELDAGHCQICKGSGIVDVLNRSLLHHYIEGRNVVCRPSDSKWFKMVSGPRFNGRAVAKPGFVNISPAVYYVACDCNRGLEKKSVHRASVKGGNLPSYIPGLDYRWRQQGGLPTTQQAVDSLNSFLKRNGHDPQGFREITPADMAELKEITT